MRVSARVSRASRRRNLLIRASACARRARAYVRLVCMQSRAACVSACTHERARECAREASCVSACARERARESCQPPPEPINSRARVRAARAGMCGGLVSIYNLFVSLIISGQVILQLHVLLLILLLAELVVTCKRR